MARDWWKDDPLSDEAGGDEARWWEDDPLDEPDRVAAPDVPSSRGLGPAPEEEDAPSSLTMRRGQRMTSSAPRIGLRVSDAEVEEPTEPQTNIPTSVEPTRSVTDTTDDARAARGFGRTNYLDGLVDAPRLPGADTMGTGVQRPGATTIARESSEFDGEGIAALSKRRGQEVAQGASGVFQSIARARGIDDRTLSDAIQRDAPGRVKEAAAQARRLEQFLADGISEDGQSPLSEQDRKLYRQRLYEAQEAVSQWADVAEFGPAFAGNRSAGAEGAARNIREWTDETFGVPPKDDSIWSDLAYGGGSMLAFVAPSIAAGPAGTIVTAQMGADAAKTEAYDRAIAFGASERDAQTAAALAGFMGTAEAAPIAAILNRLPSSVRKDVLGRIGRFASQTLQGGLEEAIQEAGVAIGQNLIAKGIYDPDQKVITKDVGEQALVGFLLGGFLGGGANAVGIGGREQPSAVVNRKPPQEDRERFDSPRLTQEDRDSPIPNDIIDDGKAALEQISQGAAPDAPRDAPQAPVAPEVDVAPVAPPEPAPVRQPEVEAAPQPTAPTTQATPDPEDGEIVQTPAGRIIIMDVIEGTGDNAQPTGEKVRVNLDTGETTPVTDDAPAEPPVEEAARPPETTPEPQATAPQPETSAPPAPAPEPQAAPTQSRQVRLPSADDRPGPLRVDLNHDETLAIKTDPSTFQYKGGGDTEGVTDRLQGVDRYDPVRAGQIIVYERRDGSRIVADGHQRTGLARRKAAEGQADVGGTTALIYRESEGYTPEEVMRIAALKNIGEGSGTAIDAARILRSGNQSAQEMGLPPRSAIVRDAEGIRRLSDDAFGMVANEIATEQHGGIVGRVVEDSSLHAEILQILKQSNPQNAAQAEIIARDAAANSAEQTQDSLFGPDVGRATLYKERAKILDGAIKELRTDRAAFNTVIKKAETLEKAGNRLDADANSRQSQEDGMILQYLQSQATRKGPINDALNQAATDLAGGKLKLGAARRGFLEGVKRAITDGGEGGGASSDGGRDAPTGEGQGGLDIRSDQTEDATETDAPGVEGEADPDARDENAADGDLFAPQDSPKTERTPEGEQNVMLGFERDAKRSEEARKGDQEREAEARKQQSKMRRLDGNTGDAGPLFDDQGDMFGGGESQVPPTRSGDTDGVNEMRAGISEAREKHGKAGDVDPTQNYRDLSGEPEGLELLRDLAKAKSLDARKKVADAWVLKHGKKTGNEHAVLMDDQGRPVAVIEGDKGNVAFPSYLVRAMQAGDIAYGTHNHPRNSGFSSSDIMIIALGVKQVVAMGHKGARVSGRRTDAMPMPQRLTNGTKTALEIVSGRIGNTLQVMIWENKITPDNASRAHAHIYSLALDHHGIIDLDGNSRDIAEKEGFNVDQIIRETSDYIRDRLRRAGFDVPEIGDRGRDQTDRGGEESAGRSSSDGRDATGGTSNRTTERDGGGRVQTGAGGQGVSRQPGQKIEDFGQKLEGAAKDRWGKYQKRLDAIPDDDVANEPLSKSFPEPDYESLIEDGVDPWAVSFVRSARDSIPNKPRRGQERWAEQVRVLRGFSRSLLNGDITADQVKEKLETMPRLKRDMEGSIDLYQAVGHSKSLKGMSLKSASYSVYKGEYHNPPKVFWEVQSPRKATAWSNFPRVVAQGETKAEAIAEFKKIYGTLDAKPKARGGTKFSIYRNSKREGAFIGTKVGRKVIEIEWFDSVQDARATLNDDRSRIEERWKQMKETPDVRRANNSPRVGKDHRGGVDITPEEFAAKFGFRGVQFGNWVEGPRRQEDLNEAYDSLMDLAGILNVDPLALSLNGELGLAFGARGKGGKFPAKAHFETDTFVINLTKKAGAGSLAHEWFHGVDNYFSRQRGRPIGFITEARNPDGIRPETAQAFEAVKVAIEASNLPARSRKLDETRSTPYWNTTIEKHARAFETYVIAKLEDQGGANDYLANIVDQAVFEAEAALMGQSDSSYPYPTAAEMPKIKAAFDKLFDTLEVVEGTTEDGRRALGFREDGETFTDQFPATFISDLAANDDLFAYPRAQSRTLEGVFGEIVPIARYEGKMSPADITADEPDVEKHLFRMPSGAAFFVYRTDGEVWFDVSQLKEGEAGNALYAAMGDYAYNSGRVFIGDPEGLSDVALRRRTEAMLSSAFKHGTTKHLEPHDYQRRGNESLGVPPLRWISGDHLANMQSLIDVSVESLAHHVPEFRRARYDFDTGTFRDSKGAPISDEVLDGWASEFGRVRAARAGRNTLKRGILFNTLLRTESGQRPGLLEQALQRNAQLVRGQIVGAFYEAEPQFEANAQRALFYSPAVRFVEGAKQKQATARDWKAILSKAPGVKKAELEWLGVDEWLDTQDGQISREALSAFLQNSQIVVVESRLAGDEVSSDDFLSDYVLEVGDPIEPDWEAEAESYLDEAREELEDRLDEDESADDITDEDVQEYAEELARQRWEPTEYDATLTDRNEIGPDLVGIWDNDMRSTYVPEVGDSVDMEDVNDWAWENYGKAAMEAAEPDDVEGPAQFEQYTEDGGENYREILLRVPDLHKTGRNRPPSDAEIMDALMSGGIAGKRPFVQSSHFEQENIVVHARVKDRKGANGEKVLFVEEIQSDLASVWRENQEAPEITERRRELEGKRRTALDEKNQLGPKLTGQITDAWEDGSIRQEGQIFPGTLLDYVSGVDAPPPSRQSYVDYVTDWVMADDTMIKDVRRWKELDNAIRDVDRELLSIGTEKRMPEGTPDTPFKEENTYALMVKRLLRMAAEEGYDRLSWTPGYMQAERWNNAAQSVVEDVIWNTRVNGEKSFRLNMSGGLSIIGSYDSRGVISEASEEMLNGKTLSSLVGPKIEAEMTSTASGETRGHKITFPDSGYAIAYDQQIRKAVDKLAKKHGASVRVDKSMPEFGGGAIKDGNPVWSVDITDALRTAALEPQPILQRPMPGANAVTPQAAKELLPKLRAALDKMGLKDVGLALDGSTDRQGAFVFSPYGAMDILIAQSADPEATLYHETVHAMRHMDLFTDAEWEALSEAAGETWIEKYKITERYPDLTREERVEEAIAEAFAEFATNKKPPKGSILLRAFSKIKRLLSAMREAIAGSSSKTVEDIFGAALSGDIASRSAGTTGFVRNAQGGFKERRAQRPTRGPGPLLGAPLHIPDRSVWEELTDANRPIWQRLKGGAGAATDALDRARFRIQDRMLPLLRAQQAIERAAGGPLPDDLNAYLVEETFSGKAGVRLDDIEAKYTVPIIEIIADAKGLSVDMVDDWLTARHAEERNKRIASMAKDMPDGGSGMTTAEARKIIADMQAGPHKAELERISALLSDMRDETLALRVEAGLITQEDADALRAMYQHYVPLKGFAETDNSEASLDSRGVGSKYSIRGKEIQRALGRRSRSFSPLQGAITQAMEVAIRAEKNRVGQSVYRLVMDYPSKAMWEIKDVQEKRFFNKTTGMIERRTASPIEGVMPANEMAVKIDGKEKRIVFHDARLAESLGSVGADGIHGALSWAAAFNRYLSMMITTLDPEFMIRNAFRDFAAAEINVGALAETDKAEIRKAMLKNWPKAWAAIEGGMRGNVDTQWQGYYREFLEAGAKVHFFRLENPEAGLQDLERRINLKSGPAALRALKVMASPRALLSSRDNKVLGFIERMNMATENAVRLAAYVEARQRGWSKQKAASLSKNLTVNFNRRGTETGWINAAFLFFNAAVQGLHVTARTMFSKRGLKVIGGLMVYGAMKDMINAALSEEDEDGILAYDKIPEYKRAMNDIWMTGGDTQITIPLPYIYAIFPYMGQQASRVMRGEKTSGDAVADVFKVALQQTSPIGVTEGFGGFLPTALQLPYEMSTNEDWLGRPIRPPNHYNDYGPNAYKYYPGVTEASREVADFLNRVSGGNAAESGFVDISPEYIDHTFSFLGGGAGRFVGRSIDAISKVATGQEVESRDIPLTRQVAYKTGTFLDRGRFYDNTNAIQDAKARMEMAIEAGEPVPPKIRDMARLSKVANSARRRNSILNKKIQEVRSNRSLTADQRKKQIELLERQQVEFYTQINSAMWDIEKKYNPNTKLDQFLRDLR